MRHVDQMTFFRNTYHIILKICYCLEQFKPGGVTFKL